MLYFGIFKLCQDTGKIVTSTQSALRLSGWWFLKAGVSEKTSPDMRLARMSEAVKSGQKVLLKSSKFDQVVGICLVILVDTMGTKLPTV